MKNDKYTSLFNEQSEEEKAKNAISELINMDWGKSNESQGKATQLFKALSFNDSTLANKFMNDINDYTTSLKDKYLN